MVTDPNQGPGLFWPMIFRVISRLITLRAKIICISLGSGVITFDYVYQSPKSLTLLHLAYCKTRPIVSPTRECTLEFTDGEI